MLRSPSCPWPLASVDLDARAALVDRLRSKLGANLAGARGAGGRLGLVLSRQTHLAASAERYIPHRPIDAGSWAAYLPFLAVIVLLLLLWWKRGWWSHPFFFAFAYFLLALSRRWDFPTTYFRYSPVFDHFQYLASMGPLALVGAGLARGEDFFIPSRSYLRSSFCAGLLLILGLLSWQRAWVFESQETLWADTLSKNPECWLAHNYLGAALAAGGQMEEAIAEYQKAVRINPNFAEGRNNLGDALYKNGQLDESMAEYEKVIAMAPNFAEAHYNLANALVKKGQVDEAIAQYQQALQIRPNYVQAHNNLGIVLCQKGRFDEGMAHLEQALRLKPGDGAMRQNLAKAQAAAGQVHGSK